MTSIQILMKLKSIANSKKVMVKILDTDNHFINVQYCVFSSDDIGYYTNLCIQEGLKPYVFDEKTHYILELK